MTGVLEELPETGLEAQLVRGGVRPLSGVGGGIDGLVVAFVRDDGEDGRLGGGGLNDDDVHDGRPTGVGANGLPVDFDDVDGEGDAMHDFGRMVRIGLGHGEGDDLEEEVGLDESAGEVLEEGEGVDGVKGGRGWVGPFDGLDRHRHLRRALHITGEMDAAAVDVEDEHLGVFDDVLGDGDVEDHMRLALDQEPVQVVREEIVDAGDMDDRLSGALGVHCRV